MNFSVIRQEQGKLCATDDLIGKGQKLLFKKIMRISFIVLFLSALSFQLLFAATGNGQSMANEKINLGLKDESLAAAIGKIEQQTTLRFFYRNADIEPIAHLNLPATTRSVQQTLEALLQNTCLTFRQLEGNILIERADKPANYEIKGRVINSADNKPVPNASVFLSNATIGGKTAADGTFVLNNARPGKYDLVVSIVGFDSYHQNITVNNSDVTLPDIVISPKTIGLSEVVVKPDPNRVQNYQKFKMEFLGTSELAQDCKILNPDVIDMDYDDATGTLTASSTDFIVIENQALGYKIKYLLTSFSLQVKNIFQRNLHFKGFAFFEELPGTPARQARWQKKRLAAYLGSQMHFFRSLPGDRLDDEGFRALQFAEYNNPQRPADSLIALNIKRFEGLKNASGNYRDSLTYWEKKEKLPKTLKTLMNKPLNREDLVKLTDQKRVFALDCSNDGLLVMYNKKHHFPTKNQLTYLDDPLNTDYTLVSFNTPFVLFDNNGGVVVPDGMELNGAWGNDRMAKLLPLDYIPALYPDTKAEKRVEDLTPQIQPTVAISNALPVELLNLKAQADSVSETQAFEKLYLQFDKPYYAVGDTIWFKAYLLKSKGLAPSDKSGIIHLDITNDSGKMVKQYNLPVQGGTGWGDLAVDSTVFAPGTYTLHAYTNWMRNDGEACFFTKTFYVADAGRNYWLVNKQANIAMIDSNKTANVKLSFSTMNGVAEANSLLNLQLLANNKRLYKQTVQTGNEGSLDVNFKVPEKSSNLVIVAENEQRDKKAIIPIFINHPANADVQFMPEGGDLVAGLPAHIGFKAIGEDGKGITLSGVIIGRDQKPEVTFQPLHNGMGSFDLAVKEGEVYTAKVTLPGGLIKEFALPAVKNSGMILQVKNTLAGDSLGVFIAATKDVIQLHNKYFLIGRACGVVCYAAIVSFSDGNFVQRKISKKLFPTGITHFTLMTVKGQPVNERLVFINHHDDLNIGITTHEVDFGKRDSIAIKIKVTDSVGNPVEGNFSMAVTADAQVKNDALNNNGLAARMLLTADLKGNVETPGYYLSEKTATAWQALDNLLLTQGWIGYDWQQVFAPTKMPFEPEQEMKVSGRVLNVFGKPVKHTKVNLFSKSPAILAATLTDDDGRFLFSGFPKIDTPVFVLNAVNRGGKAFNVRIQMDETPSPVFNASKIKVRPWYINSDTAMVNYAKKQDTLKRQENEISGDGNVLKEVNITGQKIVKESHNLNGPGGADFVMDEQELEKAGKKTWLQLLQENIKGFREKVSHGFQYYAVDGEPVRFFIDGLEYFPDLNRITDYFEAVTYYLKSRSAEEIKGMEVNTSYKNTVKYRSRYSPFDPTKYIYIELTTRSGNGPVLDYTPGFYLYKPLAINEPKQFYKPRYALKDTAKRVADQRSTIDWEPNIVTDKNGEANVSFFTAGNQGAYTLIMEGTDMNGSFGYKRVEIKADLLEQIPKTGKKNP